ncbi:sugar ABC transporter ATP-binding protein [Sinorhizobium meliloti]|jgi:ABC-type sugar transport system ATPase subunit|uniref:sugar ABC transporter ATP-binding protein n=1 Tax=Rhizobium meliloti TaxID=382 RepID=UPI000FD5E3C2|nr:sugar ABC transporter ATP-binding protein [Sinorhizobium meliloti]MQV33089.1 ATP-binding cassette domain-containing protein [Sinorhizobium meliloti]RVE79404.1 sugar ABC transporter ATP-binding protein [Sinorhizobium meliloti]RVG43833.1 sugar ABC transporter ATP-binding protein [Sinorhizobium meliloti]RVM04395.1 sugar ABC transporter ATP-binding protein [Sinorhizobium meliloti]RVM43408.1 sugar ABC transporter ATP-binding protein [Sinorhizobium meliloti]
MLSPSTIKVVRETGAVPNSEYLLEVENVRKEFAGVVALDDVSFRVRRGSVHALMGENGAGKSTLMKIIAGIYTPDAGEFKWRGQPIRLNSPLDALDNGIAMIHQELNLMAPMTVSENVWIRREPKNRFRLIDHDELRRRTLELFDRLGIDIDPDEQVGNLSVASRQMVEIAKAVSYESDVLIMDEPTSTLTEREVDHLFRIIRTLREAGKGIIYITHKMNELFEIADEVSIFRDGRHIATKAASEVTRDDVIRMMVGRELSQMFPKTPAPIGDVVLRVSNLGLAGVFEDISFDLRAGEILGIAGLVGSGRSNIAETIFGVTPATSGTIEIGGKKVVVDSPAVAMEHGMAFLTEERKESGCFLLLNIQENMQMAALRSGYVRRGFVDQKRLSRDCDAMTSALRVKTPNMEELILNLSGGNQQKVLIARWLLTKPRILILDEPTRGIDVGAKAEIHRMISNLAGEGLAVIMISSEMPEILGMSDRVMTIRQGRLSGILDRAEADQVKIMELAAQ